MNSKSERHSYFEAAYAVVKNKKTIDWFILEDLQQSANPLEGIDFIFFHDWNATALPFNKHQGYLKIKPSLSPEFLNWFINTIENCNTDLIALSNLFILYTRIDSDRDFRKQLFAEYTKRIGHRTEDIFHLLIENLNANYFNWHHLYKTAPLTAQDWLHRFRAAEGFHSESDPVIAIVKLIGAENRKIEYKWVRPMAPLVRAPLMGWYNYKLKATSAEILEHVDKDVVEAGFVAASLLDDMQHDDEAPEWVSQEIVMAFLKQHWQNIGNDLLLHTFGISYRNSGNKTYKRLEDLVDESLQKLVDSSEEAANWLNQFEFPNTYIAFFSWQEERKISLSSIPENKRELISSGIVNHLRNIFDDAVVYISEQKRSDPFAFHQMYQDKYFNAMPYFLCYILDAKEETTKGMIKTIYEFRMLHYGGFRSTHLAKHFTEFVLMMLLSVDLIRFTSKTDIEKFKTYVLKVSNSILIPYIHLQERHSEIWDKNEKYFSDYTPSRQIINNQLRKAISGPNIELLQPLYETFDEFKVAEWPYERNKE